MRNDYRHEVKHEITYSDMITIRQRMSVIGRRDPHAKDGKYFIRSLYFDTIDDKALREKIYGLACREKFRIRCYNRDESFIKLEKKSKRMGLGTKDNAPLTPDEVRRIQGGDIDWMLTSEHELIREFYTKIRSEGLIPRTIVDYTREPFIYDPGNVRVTLDYDIRTGLTSTDMLDFEAPTIPVKQTDGMVGHMIDGSPIILEVKWDNFLPEVIRGAVQLKTREQSYSKFAASRMYA